MRIKSLVAPLTLVAFMVVMTPVFAAEKEKPVDTSMKLIVEEKMTFDNVTKKDVLSTRNKFKTTIGFKGQLSKEFSYQLSGTRELVYANGERETKNDFGDSFIKFENSKTEAVLGRQSLKPAYGLMLNSTLNGLYINHTLNDSISLSFWTGNDKYQGGASKLNGVKYAMSSDVGGSEDGEIKVTGFEADVKINPKLEVRATTMNAKYENPGLEAKYYEVGSEYKLNSNLSLIAQIGGSDADKYNKAKALMVGYRNGDMKKQGSYKLTAGMVSVEKFSTMDVGYFKATGYEGFNTQIDYMVGQNNKLTLKYTKGSDTDNKSSKIEAFRAEYVLKF